MEKKSILVFLGSGGHFEQAHRLISQLGNKFEYELVYIEGDKTAKERIDSLAKKEKLVVKQEYTVPLLRIVSESRLKNKIYLFYSPVACFFKSLSIVMRSKAKYFLSASNGAVVFLYYIGKIFGKKLIYLETWSRVWTPSLTGRLVYPICNLFFVQWPELLEKYPKAKYVGRLG